MFVPIQTSLYQLTSNSAPNETARELHLDSKKETNMFCGLLTLMFVTLVFAQKEETIRACIGGNVTLKFKPAIFPHMKILTNFWNKIRGPYRDPSFAKFVPSEPGSFQTFYEDEHHSKGRIFHHADEPATLYLTCLRKSDEQKYILNTVYQNILHSSLSTINLEVKDLCFDKAKEVDKCLVTTCYTGKDGTLKTPGNHLQKVNGYREVKVCEESASGVYSCCNAAGNCLNQDLQKSQQSIDLCPQLILHESRGNYLCCNALGICQQLPLQEPKGIYQLLSSGDISAANTAKSTFSWSLQLCCNILLNSTFGALMFSILY